MIITTVAGGVYNDASFLISEDKIYRQEKDAIDKVPNPVGEEKDEVVDAPSENTFRTASTWSVTSE